jgi:DNA-binding MarR family transcriptional regulator
MTTANVSTPSRNIMTALVAGPKASKQVAAELNVKVVQVTGSLAALKKNGFVEVRADGLLVLTTAGMQLVAPAPTEPVVAQPTVEAPVVVAAPVVIARKGALKAQAAAIVARLGEGSTRKAIVTAFMTELNMSAAQASTYHYNLCGDNGMWKA